MAFWAFIPFIFAFWWLASGVPPTSCQKRFVFPRSHIKNLTAPGRAPFSDFWPLGLHFLLFWPCGPSFLAVWLCGPSFPFILAFSGSASGPPPTSCQKWPVCPTSLQWIYQRRDRLHFAVFSILGLHFLYFGLVGLHFLAFWPCGPSFPCILAFSGSASGPPPTSCQNDGMRSVQGPGGFNVLFYDGMRSVQGPGGFNVLFYFCYDVSHSATEVKKPKKVFHYVMGSFGWVGCCQSNFNTWWGAILQTPMNPKP